MSPSSVRYRARYKPCDFQNIKLFQASGIPVPDISFKLGDEDVSSEVSSETRDNNTRVAHVSVTQAGTYTCLAVNMYGNDR